MVFNVSGHEGHELPTRLCAVWHSCAALLTLSSRSLCCNATSCGASRGVGLTCIPEE